MPAFFNQATLSYNDITTTSNIVQGDYTPQLTISRNSTSSVYCGDDQITMVIGIVNSCSTACSGLTLTDNLGAYSHSSGTLVPLNYEEGSLQVYANGVLQPAPQVEAGPPLAVSGLSVPAGGNLLVLYTARVNAYAPLGIGASITGTSTLSGGCLAAPISGESVIEAACGARLTISKSICPASITCNEPVSYTLTIQNSGASPAVVTDNVIITDVFSPVLDIDQVVFNGTIWQTPANYSYNAATGVFTTNAGQITVPAASYSQDMSTGEWTVTPGTVTLTITGRIAGEV